MSFFSAFRRAQTLRRGTFPVMFSQRTVQSGITLRRFATTPPPPKRSIALYAGVGVATIGTLALFYFTDLGRETNTVAKSAAQTAKSASGFVPTKEDYQKVCFRQRFSEVLYPNAHQVYNRIAELVHDAGDYDGKYEMFILLSDLNSVYFWKMVLMGLSSSASVGTLRALTIRIQIQVEGQILLFLVFSLMPSFFSKKQLRNHAIRARIASRC